MCFVSKRQVFVLINAERRVDLSRNVLHSDLFIDILSITSDCDKHTGGVSLSKIRHFVIEFKSIQLMNVMASLLTTWREHSPAAEACLGVSVNHSGSAAPVCSSWSSACLWALFLIKFGLYSVHFLPAAPSSPHLLGLAWHEVIRCSGRWHA